MKNKKFRYSLNSKVFIIGAVIVVLLLNAILISLDSKIPLEYDFTGDNIYGLTDETKEIVDQIKEPTEFFYLIDDSGDSKQIVVKNVLEKYCQRNSKITMREIDVVKNPAAIQEFRDKVRYVGTLVIKQGDRYEIIEPGSFFSRDELSYVERVVSAKLASLIDGMEPVTLYFTFGHEERPTQYFVQKIDSVGYKIDSLETLKEDFPAAKESVVIISSPQTDFSADEIDKLDKYLEQGGNVQIYFDPIYGRGEFPNLTKYLSEDWGIVYHEHIVYDKSSVVDGSEYVFGELGDHEITEPIKKSQKATAYAYANSFTVAMDKPSNVTVHTLLSTTDNAYATVDGKTIVEEGAFEVLLAATKETSNVQNEISTGRLVVGGSVLLFDELANDTRFANEDLLLNSLNWMNGGDASITVRAKSIASGYIVMKTTQIMTWLVILVLIVPLAVLACGVVVFVKRRHK